MPAPFKWMSRIWILAIALIVHSCIDVLEFKPTQTARLLVVDGKLSTSREPQVLRLSETAPVGRGANFPPVTGARITLSDNMGLEQSYTETAPGEYILDGAAINGTPGLTYTLRIEVNGKVYESQPETMPQPIPPDSSFAVVSNQNFVSIYSSVPIPADVARGPFLKWRIDYVFQLSEFFCHPLDPTNICYVQEYFDSRLLPIFDGSQLARGQTARPFVASREANKTFGEVAFFNVYQETLTPDAYAYWNRVSLLLTQSGSLFDAPPGAIRGNVININQPEEPILGYFYAAPEDTSRVKVIASDFLPYQVNPYCGVPGFPPSPFPPECCNCTTLRNASLTAPPYWR